MHVCWFFCIPTVLKNNRHLEKRPLVHPQFTKTVFVTTLIRLPLSQANSTAQSPFLDPDIHIDISNGLMGNTRDELEQMSTSSSSTSSDSPWDPSTKPTLLVFYAGLLIPTSSDNHVISVIGSKRYIINWDQAVSGSGKLEPWMNTRFDESSWQVPIIARTRLCVTVTGYYAISSHISSKHCMAYKKN